MEYLKYRSDHPVLPPAVVFATVYLLSGQWQSVEADEITSGERVGPFRTQISSEESNC